MSSGHALADIGLVTGYSSAQGCGRQLINQHIRIIRFTVQVILPAAIDPSVDGAGRFAPGFSGSVAIVSICRDFSGVRSQQTLLDKVLC